MFVGGKWLLEVRSVPQFATFCHQMPHSCHLPAKMPHIATICRLLLFLVNSLSQTPSAIPVVVGPLNIDGLTNDSAGESK